MPASILRSPLRLGLLDATQKGAWHDLTGLSVITPQTFRKFVAERMLIPPEA